MVIPGHATVTHELPHHDLSHGDLSHGDLSHGDLSHGDEPSRPSAQVLQFKLPRRRGAPAPHAEPADPADDLARYEEEDANVDYRHRMVMNVIAVGIVTFLVGAGVWIADTIGDMEKAQDCLMQGRQNCAPIVVPTVTK
jgi:hypothetical protein